MKPTNKDPKVRQGFILGAYAAAAPGASFEEEAAYYKGLSALEYVRGMEIPFHSVPFEGFHHLGLEWFSQNLPSGLELIVTFLPGQMQAMGRDPGFGFASGDERGRQAAIALFKTMTKQMAALLSLRPDLKWRAVEIHSGPRPSEAVPAPAPRAFGESLTELRNALPDSVTLFVEHCDSSRVDFTPQKGFLSLASELEVLLELNGKAELVINWGRSALDGRGGPKEALQQITRAREAGLLRGLMFSGATESHPLYGDWLDSHAPIAEAENDQRLLLTEARIREAVAAAGNRVFVGLKIQALPVTLGVAQRLQFLERNLRVLAQAARG